MRTTPTFCDICFWKCGAIAYTRGGRLWKIEGNPDDPLSQGRLCPRGTGGIGAHYDPDRVRAPLVRRANRTAFFGGSPRGAGEEGELQELALPSVDLTSPVIVAPRKKRRKEGC